ncbi:Rho GTPase activating protein, putative [Hondaea fermentalgiana]|uniref:Rho GTPase activating protein, putative n=1 Tax=Hondaea fermentalgiana TaxID=2315210 RepID=A0A2R5GIT6_9STRA|nr:Rho GTPase activating protein, putative [Hondaea fermentalgiana]|eukprot:GBG28201.1 Rho GTPase activating protein, putative [Hondaea fermentalgiana]
MAAPAEPHKWVRICNVASGSSYYWDQTSGETSWSAPATLDDADLDALEKISVGQDTAMDKATDASSAATDRVAEATTAPQLAWERVSLGHDKEYWWNPRSDETRWSLPDPITRGRDADDGSGDEQHRHRHFLHIGHHHHSTRNKSNKDAGSTRHGRTKSAEAGSLPPSNATTTTSTAAESSSGLTASPPAADAGASGSRTQRSPGSGSGGRVRRFFGGSFGGGSAPGPTAAGTGGTGASASAGDANSGKNSAGAAGKSNAAHAGKSSEPSSSLDEKTSRKHRKSKSKGSDAAQELTIGEPFDFEHKLHVRFDAKTARYSGLPDDWDLSSKGLFGVELALCPRVEVSGYEERIPAVLVLLRESFQNLEGFTTEGIFRIAPDGEECSFTKAQLNKGKGADALANCTDPHIPANLIKQFFRELRPNILSKFSRDTVVAIADSAPDYELIEASVMDLDEPGKSVLLWLLDLMCAVSKNKDQTKMTIKNLAIVMSPNLYDIQHMPPMEALVVSQKLALALEHMLAWRRDTAEDPTSTPMPDAHMIAPEPEAIQNVHDVEVNWDEVQDQSGQSGEEGNEQNHEKEGENDISVNWNAVKADNNDILGAFAAGTATGASGPKAVAREDEKPVPAPTSRTSASYSSNSNNNNVASK